jgi:hypothetical protein
MHSLLGCQVRIDILSTLRQESRGQVHTVNLRHICVFVSVVLHNIFHLFVHILQFLLEAVTFDLQGCVFFIQAENILVEVETICEQKVPSDLINFSGACL